MKGAHGRHEHLRSASKGALGVIALNRPEAINALTAT